MAKKKWYVVIVGTAVGVFSSWLEVSPLITGVSGARHQSFATKEEALEAFSVECAKGRVKMVDASSSSGSSSIPSSSTSSRRTSPRRSQSFSDVTRSPQPSSKRTHDRSPAATVRTPSGLSHYPSIRSTDSGHSRTPSTSSSGTTTGRLSPLTLRSPTIEHIGADTDVNMTPSSRSHVTARSFRSPEGQLQVNISFPVPECANCSRNVQDTCEDALASAFSQMHVKHTTVGDKKIDPRSPMPGINYLPLSTNSAITFGRPSPSRTVRTDSVLFRRHN